MNNNSYVNLKWVHLRIQYMKSTVLKIEEAGIWLVTYLGAILVFVLLHYLEKKLKIF